MITNIEVMDKVHELLNEANTDIITRAARLLSSGAIDLEDCKDNYLLPKALIYVAMKQTADQWYLDKNKDLIKNLEHF